ncbi:MAG: glycerol-3-phosphate acyltransferase [Ruminococcus sp.]|nr:glycerol-3-phosphate acyltransferase [Ruminococcus sp.]
MSVTICLLMGYLLGSLSPAALLSKLKQKDLREHGTGNLGATNTLLTFGAKCGAFVMVFDIAKSFLSVKLAGILFPALSIGGLVAGGGAILGHVFPFYMKFKGGKGLAAFGGMVLAFDPLIFLILLLLGSAVMLVLNHGVALTMTGISLFPILTGIRTGSVLPALAALIISIILLLKHIDNLIEVKNGEDIKIRDYLKEHIRRC